MHLQKTSEIPNFDLEKFVKNTLNSRLSQMEESYKSKIISAISAKIKNYGYSDTLPDILSIYCHYFCDGLIAKKNIDEILSDGVFHILGKEKSETFFLQVYDRNRFLFNAYLLNKRPYNQDPELNRNKFVSWLKEEFDNRFDSYYNAYKSKNGT